LLATTVAAYPWGGYREEHLLAKIIRVALQDVTHKRLEQAAAGDNVTPEEMARVFIEEGLGQRDRREMGGPPISHPEAAGKWLREQKRGPEA
jgi:hypothetical protein